MLADHKKAQHYERDPKQVTNQAAFQPCSHQHTQAKRQETSAIQRILPAHKNTPCISVCRGCKIFNRLSKLF